MTGMDDIAIAARMREAIRREAIKAVRSESPPYRYATVTQIDPDIRRVMVLFEGAPSPVSVNLVGIQPSAVGQVVQVSGRTGDLFVSGVVGASQFVGVPQDGLLAPANFSLTGGVGSVLAAWEEATGAVKYELQIAEDSAFSVIIRNKISTGNGDLVTELNTPDTYYGRVRSINSNNDFSPWSPTRSATTSVFPGGSSGDGVPPESSPQPIVTGGLGFLLAEWLAVPNNDPVIYDVHLSTVSGFTPDASNKIGSTYGTFFFINGSDSEVQKVLSTSSGDFLVTESGDALTTESIDTGLDYDTVYFVRIVAHDIDGSAIPSAQGSGSPKKLGAADMGFLPQNEISDGLIPTGSPDVESIHNGPSFLVAKWNKAENPDQLVYEVHVSSTSNFTPNSNTRVGETPSDQFFIRNVGPGAGGGKLQYGTTYYVRIWAKDNDGYAETPGGQLSGQCARLEGVDIGERTITAEMMVTGTITADSGIIADLSADVLTTGSIDAQTIDVYNLSASAILGGTLDAGRIRVKNLDASEIVTGRIDATIIEVDNLNASNIKAGTLDASIVNVANINASNVKTGTLSASRIGAGIISASITINAPTITGGSINGTTVTSIRSGFERTVLSGGALRFYNANNNNFATLQGTGNNLLLTALGASGLGTLNLGGSTVYIDSVQGDAVFLNGSPIRSFRNTAVPTGTLRSSFWSQYCTTNASFTVSGIISTGSGWEIRAGSHIRSAGTFVAEGYQETSSSASCVMSSTGILRRSVSSGRFKREIQEISPQLNGVLNLRPVDFTSTASADNPRRHFVGFIAEEVEEVDYRLVTYSEVPGEEHVPEGVQYDRIPVLMLPFLRQHEEDIQVLKQQVAELRARVGLSQTPNPNNP